MVEPDDHELALRARNGEADAYGELVRRYQDSVFGVCYRLLGERRDAEDQAQEAFLRAYRRLESFDPSRPFGPWIRKVATNLCLNRLQRQEPAVADLDDERDLPLGAPMVDPERALESQQGREAVRRAILDLPPRYRAVIELRHYQDLSYAEIGEALDLPLSDVKSYLYRARKRLAARLGADV